MKLDEKLDEKLDDRTFPFLGGKLDVQISILQYDYCCFFVTVLLWGHSGFIHVKHLET